MTNQVEFILNGDPEFAGVYTVKQKRVLVEAAKIMEKVALYNRIKVSNPRDVRQWLTTKFATVEHEEFHMLWLNSQNELIKSEKIFTGTIDCASVFPREIVKKALAANAAVAIACHNHPSGVSDPSRADILITEKIKAALSVVDISLLDHFVVGHDIVSLAERGHL